MGNFLVLNLFLALLLNSFSCEELKSRKEVRLLLTLLPHLHPPQSPPPPPPVNIFLSISRESKLKTHRFSVVSLFGWQEIDEDSKLVEGLKKIRIIAKATRTLVNLSSFERSESVVSKRCNEEQRLANAIARVEAQELPTSRSHSCNAIGHSSNFKLAPITANVSPSISTGRVRGGGGGTSLAFSFEDSASVQFQPRSVYGSTEHQRPVWSSSETKLAGAPGAVDDSIDNKEPVEHEPLAHRAETLADWSILIPTVLDVVPPIEAAKLARVDTPSIVLSGQEEIPQEPPDCFPQSIHQKCGCWQNWRFLDPLCQRWRAGRGALLQVVKHPAFEWSILILIFGSSITLCFEDIYLEENPRLMSILRWTNMAFAILFALEMIIKWFALGLKYYFSSVWTALDFVIVTVSVISVAVEDSANLSALRSLRTLRALRPLRAISRWQGMKVSLVYGVSIQLLSLIRCTLMNFLRFA